MNSRLPSLSEVLYPRCFPSNPKRAEATRTILQPEIDRFEQEEAASTLGYRLQTSLAQSRSSPAHVAAAAA